MKIKKICILGGGTSGFSIASILSKYRKDSNIEFEVDVVYSEDIGTIGVGESTFLSINDLFAYLQLKDEDWMKSANATYKTSIFFENFYKKNTTFQYPFGDANVMGGPDTSARWFILKQLYPEIFTHDSYSRFMIPHSRLAEKNKLTNASIFPGFNLDKWTAYHFDSHLLSEVFKKYATNNGVNFYNDTYLESVLDENGFIKSIVCKNKTYDADLFIDCTGFNSLLLGKVMNQEFISYSDTLINHRVVRCNIPYNDKDKQLKNYTNCVALSNGWCWEIPLWNKLSLGYVHSLKFSTEEEIKKEFIEFCKTKHQTEISEDDISITHFKTGRRKNGWVKNVVGIGLSYGFLEPLESTGILTLLANSFKLLEMLSKRDFTVTTVDRDIFNFSVNKHIDILRGFIECHYSFSSRDDTDYWKYITEIIEYPKEIGTTYNDIMFRTVEKRNYMSESGDSGVPYILAGMNYSHYSPAFLKQEVYDSEFENIKTNFVNQDIEYNEILDTMDTSYQYLKKTIYK